jgi:hypothetical protein
MGLTISQLETLKAERIIDNENGGIFVGIINPLPTNPLTSQAIRFGQNELARLETFESSNTNLTYNFERNIKLKFIKTPSGSIVISYYNPELNLHEMKEWNHKQFWKNLSWGSASTKLDEIGELIKN